MINVLSYNMSWATQVNQVMGSEANFVEACKNTYTQGGFKCTTNAIKNIKTLPKLDLMCIQEVNSNVEDKIKNVQPNLTQFKRGKVGLSTVSTMWNPNAFGKLVQEHVVNLSNKNDSRPALFLVFEKNNEKIVIVNVHMPWVIREYTKNILDKVFKKLKVTNNDKIMMVGDFNDSKTTIHRNRPLSLKKKIKLSLNKNKKELKKTLKSCCWHKKGHKYGYFTDTGDYVLVNKNIEQVSLEIPKIFKKRGKLNRLFSDHMPVFSTLKL